MKLKLNSGNIQPFSGRSDVLVETAVPDKYDPRGWYIGHSQHILPPCISSSEFVPLILVEHLMRKKKDAALGVKFRPAKSPADAITNMEGALHSFVTPIVLAYLHGDYVYKYGHGVTKFEPIGKSQQARIVIVSAQVQPDFESLEVLLTLCSLKKDALIGKALPDDFSILNVADKQSETQRSSYDLSLQQHMIAYLTRGQRLPSVQEVAKDTLELPQAIAFLEGLICNPSPDFHSVDGVYFRLANRFVVSLELLFKTALHQLRNELSALEILCPQGYVYTSDPPAIFARQIGQTVLNRLQFAALKCLGSENTFPNMRAFGFNDYADRGAVSLLENALSKCSHIQVISKSLLFTGPGNTYSALPGTEGALLVIHNNSDAFGQNIETEMSGGSLDGAIGSNSSAAASLIRGRSDLVENLM